MSDLMGALMRWLRGTKPRQNGQPEPELVAKVLRDVEATQEVEYSCDDVYKLLDQFAEAVMRGEDVARRLMPLVQRHLEMCPECREEFEALLSILKAAPA